MTIHTNIAIYYKLLIIVITIYHKFYGLNWLGADSGYIPLGTILIANKETEVLRTVPNMKFEKLLSYKF